MAAANELAELVILLVVCLVAEYLLAADYECVVCIDAAVLLDNLEQELAVETLNVDVRCKILAYRRIVDILLCIDVINKTEHLVRVVCVDCQRVELCSVVACNSLEVRAVVEQVKETVCRNVQVNCCTVCRNLAYCDSTNHERLGYCSLLDVHVYIVCVYELVSAYSNCLINRTENLINLKCIDGRCHCRVKECLWQQEVVVRNHAA